MLGRKLCYSSVVRLYRGLITPRGVARPRQTQQEQKVFAAFFKKQFFARLGLAWILRLPASGRGYLAVGWGRENFWPG